jgi:hypothetical protein
MKPSISIFLTDIELATEFYPQDEKKDTNYDFMFEIIVKDKKHLRSCYS